MTRGKAIGIDLTCTESHWTTVASFRRWIEKIIHPNYLEVCDRLGLEAGKQAELIEVDVYPVHWTCEFLKNWLRPKYPFFEVIFIPGGCTGLIQLADTTLNRLRSPSWHV